MRLCSKECTHSTCVGDIGNNITNQIRFNGKWEIPKPSSNFTV